MDRKWLVLGAATASLSMVMLDQTVVSVALPTMARDLPLSTSAVQWVVNIYVLSLAALVALGGKLGDKFGRARTFQAGVVIFFLASVGCALAPAGGWGQEWLLASRTLQGAGAAALLPVSASLVMGSFAIEHRGKAMAIYAGTSQIFLAIGPLLGGVLAESASWRWVFWINVPVGLAALTLIHLAKPANATAPGTRIRALDVALLIGGVGPLVVGLQQGNAWGWSSPSTLAPLAVGAVLLTVFVLQQIRRADPLVQLRLLQRRAFLGDIAVVSLVQFALLAMVLFGGLYLQDVMGFSPVKAGLATLPMVLPLTVMTRVGGQWLDLRGVRAPVLTGLSVALVGVSLWAIGLTQMSYWWQVPGMVIAGVGVGLTISPTNTDALSRAADAERSQASGLLQTSRQLGGTLGVAIVGAVILGLERDGTQADEAHRAAHAVATGYGVAAAAFGVALLVAWLLLAHRPLDTAGDTRADAPADHRLPPRMLAEV